MAADLSAATDCNLPRKPLHQKVNQCVNNTVLSDASFKHVLHLQKYILVLTTAQEWQQICSSHQQWSVFHTIQCGIQESDNLV